MILVLGFIGDLIDDKINLKIFDKLSWFLVGLVLIFCLVLWVDIFVGIELLIFIFEVLRWEILGSKKIFEIIGFILLVWELIIIVDIGSNNILIVFVNI